MVNQNLKVSDKLIDLLKEFEGLHRVRSDGRIEAYLDTAGKKPIWTIGWGHTRTAKPDMVITLQQAIELKKQDLVEHENHVKRLVKVPLTQGQFDALTSLCYNLGQGKFAQSSVLKAVNANDWEKAKKEQLKWVRGSGNKILPGLVRRREAEVALMDDKETPAPAPRALAPIAANNRPPNDQKFAMSAAAMQQEIRNPNTLWARLRSAIGV